MPSKWEVGKTYNGHYKDLYFVFEVTDVIGNRVECNCIYSEAQGDRRHLQEGEVGFDIGSGFESKGVFRESLTAVNFTKALDDLSLMLKNEDLFKHFNKTGKGVVKA